MSRQTNSDLPNEHGQNALGRPLSGATVRPTFKEPVNRDIRYAIAPPCSARSFNIFTQTSPDASQVLGANGKRRGLFVQNLGASDLYLSIGTPAGFDGTNFTGAMLIPVGASYESPAFCAPVDDVYLVSAVQTQAFILESTIQI